MTDRKAAFSSPPITRTIAQAAFVASAERTLQQPGPFPQSGSPGLDERRR